MYTLEEFDKQKTKILKYIMFQKRTETEIRQKFNKTIEENLLEDIIQYLKQANYIDDKQYIEKKVSDFIMLNTLSIKEIKYKLLSKGTNKQEIDDFFEENKEELQEYEVKSAKKILLKKANSMDNTQIAMYLRKKGYNEDSIKNAIEEIKEE